MGLPMNTLKEALRERGMTALELSEAVKAPYCTILSYTSGARGVGTKWLYAIACALDVEPASLLPTTPGQAFACERTSPSVPGRGEGA